MGNEPPKKQKQQYQPRLEKQKLEIACIKVIGHLEIQRDRRIGQGAQKEKALIQMMNAPQRSKVEEVHKASSIVTDMNFIKGCDIVIRYCGIIKDRSLLICESVGQPQNIEQLLPYIESVIWASKYLNLNAMQEFQALIMNFFGAQGIDVTQSDKVDKELKQCFESVMPTPLEINEYILKLTQKTGMTLQQINAVGHEFTDQPQQPPQQGGAGQPDGQFNQPPGGQPNGQFNQPPGGVQPGVGGYFPNQQQQQQQDPYGRVINVNVQVQPGQFNQPPQQGGQQFQQPPQQGGQQFNQPPQQGGQFPQQQQQPSSGFPSQQGGFNQPPSQGGFNQPPQQSGSNQPPSQGGFNQPPSQGGFNQPPQQGSQQSSGFNNNQAPNQFGQQQPSSGFNQPPQQGGFNQPPQQSGGINQPPASAGYPGLESQNMGNASQQSNNTNISNPFGQQDNSNQGNNNLQNQFNQLPPPQQQQQFQPPQVQAGVNQPPQQQQQSQPPQQQNQPPQQSGELDSLEERLKRLREGV